MQNVKLLDNWSTICGNIANNKTVAKRCEGLYARAPNVATKTMRYILTIQLSKNLPTQFGYARRVFHLTWRNSNA